MENDNYFTKIPLDLFLMICEPLLIDRIHQLCELRNCSSHFFDQLYKMKFGSIPEGESTSDFFHFVWRMYVEHTQKKEYRHLLLNMSAQGMINEVNYILRTYQNKFDQSDYIHCLKIAIENNHFQVVERLFKIMWRMGYEPKYIDLLKISVRHGRFEIFKYLFEWGRGDLYGGDCFDLLKLGIQYGRFDIIKHMFESVIKIPDEKYLDLMKISIEHNKNIIFEYLLKSAGRGDGRKLLETAIEYGNVEIFEYLFSLVGESFDDREYSRLIWLATKNEDPNILELLIHARQNVAWYRLFVFGGSKEFIRLATEGNNEKVTEIIFRLGETKIDWPQAFIFSAQTGYKNLLRYSSNKLVNLRKMDKLGKHEMRDEFRTAFREAALNDHLEILKFLIEHSPDEKTITYMEYEYGIHISAEKNYPEIIKYLSSLYKDRDSDLHALFLAVKHDHENIVKLLLNLISNSNYVWWEIHLYYDRLLEMAKENKRIVNLLIKFKDDILEEYYYHQISELAENPPKRVILGLLFNMNQCPPGSAYYYKKIIEESAKNGYLDVLELVEQLNAENDVFPEDEDEYYYWGILRNAAKGGQKEVMKWIIEENKILDEEFGDAIGDAFAHASLNGQREIMEWIISYLGDPITKDYYIEALEYAISKDQEEIAKWIYKMIKNTLTREDITNMMNRLEDENPSATVRKSMDDIKSRFDGNNLLV